MGPQNMTFIRPASDLLRSRLPIPILYVYTLRMSDPVTNSIHHGDAGGEDAMDYGLNLPGILG